MEAVRQIYKVNNNGSFTVHLPAEFRAEEVEVIVLPTRAASSTLQIKEGEDDGLLAIQCFLSMDTAHFTAEQLVAYKKSSQKLQRWIETGEGPLFGVFEGLIKIDDDFDDTDQIDELFYADNIEPQ